MSALQVSLLCRPSPSLFSLPKPSPPIRAARHLSSAALRSHRSLDLFHPHAALSQGESSDKDPILDPQAPQNPDVDAAILKDEEAAAAAGGDGGGEESVAAVERKESRLPLLAFLIGVRESVRRGFDWLAMSEWLSWWPFWRQEKRLERLIAEADANPKDAAKQSALLAELNKHSPESVIRRYEERSHAIDSKGVAEYLRALVVTNALAEYLPDERLGKPSSLPTLLQELKQRASGDDEEAFLNPGISEKQPLRVVMVDPKASNRSTRFAQELVSTILFTIVVGLMWVMGASALQKYVGSLGGIGTSGVGSSATYAPKDLNKEIMPERNVKTFKDVKGCDDAKQELEEVVEYLKNPGKFTRLGGKLPKVFYGYKLFNVPNSNSMDSVFAPSELKQVAIKYLQLKTWVEE